MNHTKASAKNVRCLVQSFPLRRPTEPTSAKPRLAFLVSPAAEGEVERLRRKTSPLAASETRSRISEIAFLKVQPTEMSDGPVF